MRSAVYNSAIPKVINPAAGMASGVRLLTFFLFVLALPLCVHAADWNAPEQQLARKIVAITGPGAIAVTIDNRSTLGQREVEIVSNGLRAALEATGIRSATPEQAVATVAISLSENPRAYVWVAEIHQGSAAPVVVMISAVRPEGTTLAHDSVPLMLRKTAVWSQQDRILDVLALDDAPTPAHIAVLSAENISLYRMQNAKWTLEESLAIVHARTWPRDLRGRLFSAKDHLLDAYLPGMICHATAGAPLALNCRESDDPWPLAPISLTSSAPPSFGTSSAAQSAVMSTSAFFASSRNFFTGALAPGVGKFSTVAKFFSSAAISREKYVLWLFASVDGQVHLVDGVTDQAARLNWGSDIASVKTGCGAGWQVLATSSDTQNGDQVRAFEFPDRDPVPVSAAMDFPGEITALWTESKGETAIAVVQNRESGEYEAFRLAVACNQ